MFILPKRKVRGLLYLGVTAKKLQSDDLGSEPRVGRGVTMY